MALLSCSVCDFQVMSSAAYLKHMKIHSLGRNLLFKCPLCPFKGSSHRGFETHVSRSHNKQSERRQIQIPTSAKCLVEACGVFYPTVDQLKDHLKEHLLAGVQITCPFGSCPHPNNTRQNKYTKFSNFQSHLSRNHPKLKSTSFQPPVCEPQSSVSIRDNSPVPLSESSVGGSHSHDEMEVDYELDKDESLVEEEACFEVDVVCDFIARWYLKMEGELFIPASSVQSIAEGLASVVELSQGVVKKKMIEEMMKKNMKREDAEDVAFVTLNSDPLLRTHHKNFRSVCLLTSHRRYVYYKDNFNFIEPKKETVGPSPSVPQHVAPDDPDDPQPAVQADSPAQPAVPEPEPQPLPHLPVQQAMQPELQPPPDPQPKKSVKVSVVRVPIKESLAAQLKDSQVEADIDASFVKFSSPAPAPAHQEKIYRDFSDGSVFANHPGRSKPGIFLLFFCDAFGTTNPIGSSKDKHKTVGIYYSIGNLPPEKRSRIDVVELSQLFLEVQLKVKGKGAAARRAKKAKWDQLLQPLIQELKELHKDGVEYKGGRIPVHFLYMMGDNLGQHQIGGFSESFSGDFWCRYCAVSADEFQADPCAYLPFRTREMYSACVEEAYSLRQTSCQGVKFDSILNSIDNFHVCNPGLPPCIAHDMFEGIVAEDMMLIIKYFISKKWFTRLKLNEKIKSFAFVGLDAADKPNTIGLDSKGRIKSKLSGSAVKNWNLLRFFALLVMDFIQDPNDPVWQLYLKLKVLAEQICAPQISESGIVVLDNNVQLYLLERKCLFPEQKLKPKHHFLRHIPALIRMFGPLIRLWTLRMESFHSVLKRAARASNNFINIPVTMAFKTQLRKCNLSVGNVYQNSIVFTIPRGNAPLILPRFQAFIATLNIPTSSICVNTVRINGIDYKRDMWLLLKREESRLIVGEIKLMFCGDDSVIFILKNYSSSTESNNVGLHEIDLLDDRGLTHLSSLKTLESFYPLHAYSINGRKYLTLKHSPLPNETVPSY